MEIEQEGEWGQIVTFLPPMLYRTCILVFLATSVLAYVPVHVNSTVLVSNLFLSECDLNAMFRYMHLYRNVPTRTVPLFRNWEDEREGDKTMVGH